MTAARYSAECWADGKTKEQILEEIKRLKSLWTLKHPNPFPHSAHYANVQIETLERLIS